MDHWVTLIWGKLARWGYALIRMLPNMALAILVMLAFIIAARVVRKLSGRFLHRLSKSEAVSTLTSSVIYTLILMVGLMVALKILRLDQAVTSLLAGVGIIGLALGFAFQDITSNFISGAFIVFKRPFDVGHTVETNGFVGRVQNIELRSTTVETLAGLHVIIPNKDIFQKPIINYTLTSGRRVELEFPVQAAMPLEALADNITQSLAGISTRTPSREPEAFYAAVDDGKVKLYVSFWTDHAEPDQFLQVKNQAVLMIMKAIRESTPAPK